MGNVPIDLEFQEQFPAKGPGLSRTWSYELTGETQMEYSIKNKLLIVQHFFISPASASPILKLSTEQSNNE